ncbi:tonB-system energizer ExbB [Alcanivorax xiamenensis]|nr:tonB-system energizer ExbB [Alcanivorax xiamenensis]
MMHTRDIVIAALFLSALLAGGRVHAQEQPRPESGAETGIMEAALTETTDGESPGGEGMDDEARVEEPAAQVGEGPVLPHDLSPWGMYQAADPIVKAVMISLLLASLLTWTVWVFKLAQLFSARRRAGRVLAALVEAPDFADGARHAVIRKGDGATLVRAAEHELVLSSGGPVTDEGLKERVAARLDRVQVAAGSHMNKGTGVLATIGAVAPFVGLFGTVWGIMNSFIGIARTQTTNLAVVAPGIAEALLATGIGLVAAIPAVIIYNHFARSISRYRALLGDIATALMTLISRDLDRHHPRARALASVDKEAAPGVVTLQRSGG